jgi:uncharacterized membrane protein YgcG
MASSNYISQPHSHNRASEADPERLVRTEKGVEGSGPIRTPTTQTAASMRTAVSTASIHDTHTLHTLYRRLHCRAENMRSVCSWDPACSSPSRLCRRRACPASSRAQEGAREGHHHTHRPCLTPLPCQLSPLPIPPLALERRGQRTDLRTESGRSGGGGSGCGCGGSGRLRRRRRSVAGGGSGGGGGEMLRFAIGRVLMKGHGPYVLPQDELKELVVLFSAKRRLQTYKRGSPR